MFVFPCIYLALSLIISNLLTLLFLRFNSSILIINKNILTYLNSFLIISMDVCTSVQVCTNSRTIMTNALWIKHFVVTAAAPGGGSISILKEGKHFSMLELWIMLVFMVKRIKVNNLASKAIKFFTGARIYRSSEILVVCIFSVWVFSWDLCTVLSTFTLP